MLLVDFHIADAHRANTDIYIQFADTNKSVSVFAKYKGQELFLSEITALRQLIC